MGPIRHVLTTLIALSAAAPLGAQRTWIVDQSNGSGTDHTDLWPALLTARDGDTIRVRKGTYTTGFVVVPIAISRAIKLIGEPGAVIAPRASGSNVFQLLVSRIPAGRTFVMKGFLFRVSTSSQGVIVIDGNAGRVVLSDITVQNTFPPILSGPRPPLVTIRDTRVATLNRCDFSGDMSIHRSTVAIGNSRLRGFDARLLPPVVVVPSAPSIVADRSTLSIAHTRVSGGHGLRDSTLGVFDPSPGIRMSGCALHLTGDKQAFVEAGILAGRNASAISGTGGRLVVDPSVVLRPTGTATDVSGTISVTRRPAPSLTAHGAPPGGTAKATVYGRSGDVAILLASLPADPIDLPGLGSFWLDFNSLLLLGATVLDATERWQTSFPIPNQPSLLALPLTYQAFAGPVGQWVATPPVGIIHW